MGGDSGSDEKSESLKVNRIIGILAARAFIPGVMLISRGSNITSSWTLCDAFKGLLYTGINSIAMDSLQPVQDHL
jgi:hypothetical protein